MSFLRRVSSPAFNFLRHLTVLVWGCRRRGKSPGRFCWFKRAIVVIAVLSLLPVIAWRWLPPPMSSVMLQRTIQERAWQDYQWVPMESISPSAALAVVAAEDQLFPVHNGFDLDAIQAALDRHRDGGRLRGGSTITQQVAKNLFLWEGRSWLRKGLEAWYAVLLELLWPKERILEIYLNIAEMGHRTFGVGAASRRFFARPAAELTDRQAATLAAVLPNPRVYRVDAPSATVLKRRDWVLRQMRQLGGVSYLEPVIGRRSTPGA